MSFVAALLQLVASIMMQHEATLLFAGDAMMHQAQIDAARQRDGSYAYFDCFEQIKPVISAADYAVVNLETPLGDSNFTGYPCFNSPATYADALADAGFDLFLTANNHTLDRRDRGLHSTLNHLDSRGLEHIGTYHDRADRDSLLPKIVDVNGFKIGFLNYTYGTNGIEIQEDAVVDYIDRAQIKRDYQRLRSEGAELTVAAVHWGEEYKLLPTRSQQRLANFLDSLGVDMVIGAHPHVIQPMEMRVDSATGRRRLVVYSLGNFISNMKTRDTRGGAIVEVKLRRDSIGRPYVDSAAYRLVFTVPPTAVTSRSTSDKPNFMVVPIDSVPASWRAQADAFASSATSIFRTHNVSVGEKGGSTKTKLLKEAK